MKTIALIILLLPVTILAQVCPNNANEFGILGVEVYGNSAILKNDSVCRNCGAEYEMIIYQLAGDTLGWYQKGSGLAICDCLFNLSVTLDSLNPGDYFVKTSFQGADTVYIGLITFTIIEQNSFSGFVKTDEYQSPCGIVGTDEHKQMQNSITLSPNPASDQLTINALDVRNKTIYQIYNSSGLKLIEGEIKLNETQLDISALPRGVYFVRLQNEKMVEMGKMVKE